jgi:hypothetical protein
MKKTIATTAILTASLLFAGNSLARSVQADSEGDMLYGGGAVAASPSQPYVITGPVQSDGDTDFLYNRDEFLNSPLSESPDRFVDDRDFSNDLIYGYQI